MCQKFISNIITFLTSPIGCFANSVDPDQPASEEAGWSGSTLFFKQFMLCHIIWKLVDVKVTSIDLLKIASDGNFSMLFWKKYWHLASKKVLNLIPAIDFKCHLLMYFGKP